ncbi:Hydroxypyruvate isomerase [Indibacter alkaliphilus LW1]|jgi:hydroxypyruvate isomerase|uniref:Hydroxypyruvate isomerase n=1 Tax=Indibacter alkaliphilus (strain CCUG 57479 / KCTC 22604 / LW1) TaxID=1189612 RepID=S2D1I2_INDAL|nr:TIM barrel protein [Indibacter alkaliphilus]EOZ93207.1 Hydroxypyruvate isomerase [Indibacter alkaliphilus LW1]
MTKITRRNSLKKITLGAAALSGISILEGQAEEAKSPLKGNVNHAVCHWPFNPMSLEDLCIAVKKIGFNAIDLVGPNNWHILKKHGVECSLCNGAELSIEKGWNDPQYHDELIARYTDIIPKVAEAGYKNLICFSGNRNGMDDATGMKNCAEGLKKITGLAEKHGVTLIMELLNSRVDHRDYMCDKSAWGIELCKMVESENFKLLYDIYHMQIMEGDIIRSIKNNHQYFGHYHTAGNPGRNEIDDTQEINYPAVVRAVLDTGYTGYFCQEFIPTKTDKIASLEEAIKICDL